MDTSIQDYNTDRSSNSDEVDALSDIFDNLPRPCLMDLARFRSSAHGHPEFGGLSRVVMVRKLDQRTFTAKDGQEVVTRETIETFRGDRTERKVTTLAKRDSFSSLPSDLSGSLSEGTPDGAEGLEDELLRAANERRARHNACALRLCPELRDTSREIAEALASGNFSDENNHQPGVGMITQWAEAPASGRDAVEAWYAEGRSYNYGTEPENTERTSRFTQLLWKASERVGVSTATSDDGRAVIVALFSPPGNVTGRYTENVAPADGGACFERDCLAAHNEYRALHGSPPLHLSRRLCKYSQQWAEALASRGRLEHRPRSEYGENLFCSWVSGGGLTVSGREPVDNWYAEVRRHVFHKEPATLRSGHFTQIVWRDSRDLGIGFARSRHGQVFVVANYSPPGNFIGSFTHNVPPLGGFAEPMPQEICQLEGEDFAQQGLRVHNDYRKRHGVPALTLSTELCEYAQEWAEAMARDDHFSHRPRCDYGENIFGLWSSDPRAVISARSVCRSWYAEAKDHRWDVGERARGGAHFTQMIWRSSKEMGMAAARNGRGKIYVVANYRPRGNVIGQFADNVSRPL